MFVFRCSKHQAAYTKKHDSIGVVIRFFCLMKKFDQAHLNKSRSAAEWYLAVHIHVSSAAQVN